MDAMDSLDGQFVSNAECELDLFDPIWPALEPSASGDTRQGVGELDYDHYLDDLPFANPLDMSPSMSGGGMMEGESNLGHGLSTSKERAASWPGCFPTPTAATISSSPSTSTSIRRQVCRECKAEFNTGDSLEAHAIEHKHRIFICSKPGCRKAYFRRDNCARHVTLHNARLESCPVCRAEFARKDHLKRHMRVQHPDECSPTKATFKGPSTAHIDIRKVKESEPALRQSLSPDNLAIKMLDIAGKSASTAEGAQMAFACVIAHAALSESEVLSAQTVRRLESVKTGRPIETPDLEVLDTLEVGSTW